MADVTLSYKGSDILELSDSGSATLKTGGKYCEDDIAVEYVKPSGGSSIISGEITLASKRAGLTVEHNANLTDYLFIVAVKSTEWDALVANTSETQDYTAFRLAFCSTKLDYMNSMISRAMLGVKYTPSSAVFGASSTNPTNNNTKVTYTNNTVTFTGNYGFHATTYKWWVIPIDGLTV